MILICKDFWDEMLYQLFILTMSSFEAVLMRVYFQIGLHNKRPWSFIYKSKQTVGSYQPQKKLNQTQ